MINKQNTYKHQEEKVLKWGLEWGITEGIQQGIKLGKITDIIDLVKNSVI